LLERIALGGDKGTKVHKVVGVSAEALIVYLAHDWPEVWQCQQAMRLMESGKIDYNLLARISEIVALSLDDLEQLRELHFKARIPRRV
jgi:hypothetical protein